MSRKPDKSKALALPKEVYYQCVWVIRDIDRLRMLEAVHRYGSGQENVMFCNDDLCTMVTEAVMEEAEHKLWAIRAALDTVPAEMRQTLLDNIISGAGFGDYAHENTWKKWKKRFIYNLARYLDLI